MKGTGFVSTSLWWEDKKIQDYDALSRSEHMGCMHISVTGKPFGRPREQGEPRKSRSDPGPKGQPVTPGGSLNVAGGT